MSSDVKKLIARLRGAAKCYTGFATGNLLDEAATALRSAAEDREKLERLEGALREIRKTVPDYAYDGPSETDSPAIRRLIDIAAVFSDLAAHPQSPRREQ